MADMERWCERQWAKIRNINRRAHFCARAVWPFCRVNSAREPMNLGLAEAARAKERATKTEYCMTTKRELIIIKRS